MPSTPYTFQRRVDRFRDQRSLLDAAPMRVDHRAPVMGQVRTGPTWQAFARSRVRARARSARRDP